MSYVELAKEYAGKIEMPSNKQEGLANAIRLVLHAIARNDVQEAVYQLANLLDDVQSNSNPYEIGGKKRKAKASSSVPKFDPKKDGDFSEWLVSNNID